MQILAGELASQFALSMGFVEESLTTAESKEMWKEWRNNNCQPNYWTVHTYKQIINMIYDVKFIDFFQDVTPDSNGNQLMGFFIESEITHTILHLGLNIVEL